MPENRLAKARRSLPIGYQFGDAGKRKGYQFGSASQGLAIRFLREWTIKADTSDLRRYHETGKWGPRVGL